MGLTKVTFNMIEGAVYNVLDNGADPTGIDDSTAAIQAAVDAAGANGRGCVYLPSGQYKVTSTITINSSAIAIVGDGAGSTFVYPYGDYGDVLHFTTGVAGTYLQRNSIRDIAFYSQDETTSGATIHLERCRLMFMSNVDISAHFGGLLLDTVVHSSFSNVNILSDAEFTSYKAGSYLMKSVQNASGVLPAECHFVNCDWRGQNGNNYLDYAVIIQAADGLWFSNVHWGFCKTAALAIVPQTTTTQITAINVSNCYFDTVQSYGVQVAEPVGYTGTVAEICITNGQIYNCNIGIGWNCNNNGSSVISNMQIFEIGTHAVQVTKGTSISFSNISAWAINKTATTGFGFDLVGADAQYIQISNCSVRERGSGFTPSAGISIGASASNIRISGMEFEGCTEDIANNSTTSAKEINDSFSDKENVVVSADVGGGLDLPQGFSLFFLGTANAVGAITARSGWAGRRVTLVANGTVDVYDTSNLIIAGTWSATLHDTLTLVCDGTNWFEVSRSNNT